MANFNTHFSVAAVGSGMLATLCLQVGFVDAKDALLLTATGTIGGILPDIDLHYSYPSRILFSALGIIFAFLWIFSAENYFSIIQLWGAGLGIFLFIRYPAWALFNKFTVHRGIIHSIPSAILFCFLSAVLSFHVFGKTPFISWLIAFFVFLGFILHLVLDEMFSVDFMGRRLKRSFGTALKLVDTNEKIGSAIIVVAIILCWFFTPRASEFLGTIGSADTYRVISYRFFNN